MNIIWDKFSIKQISNTQDVNLKTEQFSFCYTGKKVARISQNDKYKLSELCNSAGFFSFEEGFETLKTMFFYRCEWLKCIIFPKSMRFVEQYSCVPYVKISDYKYIHHTKSDYRYPSEYAQRKMEHGWYISKTEKIPMAVVIKSPNTCFDNCAFGDGDEEIVFFLEFHEEYKTSNIKSKIIMYKPDEWDYVNGIPTPHI